MKVQELIDSLSGINPDATVYIKGKVFSYKLDSIDIDNDKCKENISEVFLQPFTFSNIFNNTGRGCEQ